MKQLIKKLILPWLKVVELYSRIQFLIFGVKCGSGFSVKYKPLIIHAPIFPRENKLIIGNNVNINSSAGANLIGKGSRTILFATQEGRIKIGNNVGMSNVTIVSHLSVTVNDGACLGGGVCIYDTDFHSEYAKDRNNNNINVVKKPVVIGKDAFIGAGATILKGVTIGERAVIGACSVVTKMYRKMKSGQGILQEKSAA